MNRIKFTAIIAVAVLICAVSIMPAFAQPADLSVSSFSALEDAISAAPDDGSLFIIEVTDNITLTNESSVSVALTIPAGTNIKLTSDTGSIWTLSQEGDLRHLIVNGSLTLENIILDGNNNRGGILADGGALAINDGAVVTRCSARVGSGIELKGSQFTMNGGEISYNQFTEKTAASGGGISLEDSTVVMNGGSIHHNISTWGGGIEVGTDGHFTMNGGEIHSNEASAEYGGGVHVYVHGTFVMNAGSISKNKVHKSNAGGGGVFVGQGSYVSGEPTDWCRFIINGGFIEENSADGGAGVAAFWNGDIEMNGGIIRGNTAGIIGGGVMVAPLGRSDGVSFIMNGGEISGNSSEQYGGGVAIWGPENDNIDVRIGDGAGIEPVIRSNRANSQGGGMVAYQAGATMRGGNIEGNHTDSYGGGVCILAGSTKGGIFTMTGGVIGGNNTGDANTAALSGGGVATSGNGNVFTMTGGEIDGNTAEQNGGGIYIRSATDTVSLTDALITDNSAAGNGGGLYSVSPATDVVSTSIQRNTAALGGGVYVTSGAALNASINTSFSGNTASGEGGGIYTEDFDDYGSLTLSDYQNITTDASTIFTGNTAYAAYAPPDIVYDYTNIGYSTTSVMKSASEYIHPINNYDINYVGETPYAPLYTVVYDANGGTGGHQDVVSLGASYTILSNTATGISRAGYTFTGWNLQPNGTGRQFDVGEISVIDGDLTVYAQWLRDDTPVPPSPTPSSPEPPSPTPGGPKPPSPTPDVTEPPTEIPGDGTPLVPPENPDVPDTTVPKTGDSSKLSIWPVLVAVSMLGLSLLYGKGGRKDSKNT